MGSYRNRFNPSGDVFLLFVKCNGLQDLHNDILKHTLVVGEEFQADELDGFQRQRPHIDSHDNGALFRPVIQALADGFPHVGRLMSHLSKEIGEYSQISDPLSKNKTRTAGSTYGRRGQLMI